MTAEGVLEPEEHIHLNRIDLSDGETAWFDGEKYQTGSDPEYFGDYYAEAGTFIVGKNGPELEASGGDCRVVCIYNHKLKLGVVIHVDAADMFSDGHVKFLGALKQVLLEVFSRSEAYVFGDIDSSNPDIQSLRDVCIAWNDRIFNTLSAMGITSIQVVTKGEGKNVSLGTADGNIRVTDVNDNLIFEKI